MKGGGHVTSDRAKRGVEQLHSLYKAHVEKWDAALVASKWPEFQAAVRTMVMRMIVKIDREEADLFPLIEADAQPGRNWQPGMRNWAGDGVALQSLITGTLARHPTETLIEVTQSAIRP